MTIRLLLLSTIVVSFLSLISYQPTAEAQSASDVDVAAEVSSNGVSISGFVSPLATISIYSGSTLLRTTTADSSGNYSFTALSVTDGTTQLCFVVADYYSLGNSTSCLTIDMDESTTYINVMLPPTIHKHNDNFVQGLGTTLDGYTMPNGTVLLYQETNQTTSIQADNNGYWSYSLNNMQAGYYTYYVKGVYSGTVSLTPTGGASIRVLTPIQNIQTTIQTVLQKVGTTSLTLIGLTPLDDLSTSITTRKGDQHITVFSELFSLLPYLFFFFVLIFLNILLFKKLFGQGDGNVDFVTPFFFFIPHRRKKKESFKIGAFCPLPYHNENTTKK